MLYLIYLRLFQLETYHYIVAFEGIVEDIQAWIFYLTAVAAGIVSVKLFFTKKTMFAWLYSGLALALFFVTMEEISWGQRFIPYDAPEVILDKSLQGEMTFHNLDSVFWMLNFVHITVGLLGVFLIYLILKNIKMRFPDFINLFIPGRPLFFYFIFHFIVYFCSMTEIKLELFYDFREE
ncbi:MAG: hypothetical protein H6755_00750 [Candidatus Omnitrophica bacterium]|nr:hypothetical protein [Candidatus Omnitrophota bacterium]MCB9746917.1 hypothetical protein [Candidatus Omnitrophota bacterium]